MRRRKHIGNLKYLAIALIAVTVLVFFFLRRDVVVNTLPQPQKHQAGYKTEDRQKLEQLIHQGAKDD